MLKTLKSLDASTYPFTRKGKGYKSTELQVALGLQEQRLMLVSIVINHYLHQKCS